MTAPVFTRPSLPRRLRRQASVLALACGLWALAAPPASSQAPAATPAAATAAPAAPAIEPTSVSALAQVPAPTLAARAWLLLDANSGQVVAAQGIDEAVEPASLTKLMTAYMVFQAVDGKRMSLEQPVHVSETAWKTEGSRMFIKPNTQVTVDELLKGVIVQSGNDATVALAEALAGSEAAFATLMNQEAARQGLASTHYVNASGLPDPTHLTSVRDLATLAHNLIRTFPHHLHYYRQKEYTYNKISQNNRNRLLWTDSTVDGLKTGHTKSAGYCLVATAQRDGRRLISVVVGAASDSARAEASLRLLNWGFQNFETLQLYDDQKPAARARVWEGQADTVGLGGVAPAWVTVPRGRGGDVQLVARYAQPLIAPLTKGSEVGTVLLSLDGKVLREEPLYVLEDVPQAGFFGRVYDKVRLWFE